MTIVIEMADGSVPTGTAAAAGCHFAHGEGTDRRRGNERRGAGQAATPSPAARCYGFRCFRDRRSNAGKGVLPTAEPGAGHPFRSTPNQEQFRLLVAAAYGDCGDSAPAILHRIDLCL